MTTDVRGPDGRPITAVDLPPKGLRRYTIRKKALIVAGVSGGLISIEEARDKYALSAEEFIEWQRAIDRHGLAGLRTTYLQRPREMLR